MLPCIPRALHLLAQLFRSQLPLPSRSNAARCRRAERDDSHSRRSPRDPPTPCTAHSQFASRGRLTASMTGKRKRSRDDSEQQTKRQRRRKRSRSEPLISDPQTSEKRQALKRLFGRICSVEMENEHIAEEDDFSFDDREVFGDENEDPLLDSVPVNMDPEQLGFLVCAQETLRFLHGRGIPTEHPVFARLRSRLLRGIGEMAVA
ncbi:unnamed protein product [Leptosia nina]|uniref:Uncharacterized protein n=1 Tax=Leptosia nina TaxID=320188 RepID=A0AAV1K4A4_9NEOP